MKKTIAITEECNQLLKELAEKNDTTESKIVKWAIEEYAARNKPEHPDEIVEIRRRIVKIQEQNFHLLNMLNSFSSQMTRVTFQLKISPAAGWRRARTNFIRSS